MPKFNTKTLTVFTLILMILISSKSIYAEPSVSDFDNEKRIEETEINSIGEVELFEEITDPRIDGPAIGGPIELEEARVELPQAFAAPAGGPHVGQLTKVPRKVATTVNIFTTADLTTRITYLENGMNSGVFPILDQSGNSYKIALSGVVGWVDNKYVDIFQYAKTGSGYDYYQVKNGRLYHYIGGGVNSGKTSGALDQGPAPDYLRSGQYISYDGHYFYDCTVIGLNKLISDYNSNTRKSSINPSSPFYNYFMWLPARTQSTITDEDLRNSLVKRGYNTPLKSRLYETEKLFINNGHRYAGNSTLAFATAIHESGWGTSAFARQRNNYFGHAAYDSEPTLATAYLDPDEGISFHFATYWSWRYLYPTQWNGRNKGGSVGNKGIGMNVDYASDPYWGEKIANYYFILDSEAQVKDYGRYKLGIFNAPNVPILKEATGSSNIVYESSRSGMPVAILEDKNGYYGFTSDLILDKNKNQPPEAQYTSMNFATSTVYTQKTSVNIIHEGKGGGLLKQENIPFPTKPTVNKAIQNYIVTKATPLSPNTTTIYTPISTLPVNAVVEGRTTSNGWIHVIYNGNIGFIAANDAKLYSGANTPQPGTHSTKTTYNVNLRESPNSSAKRITTVQKGQTVIIGAPVNGWVHAKYGNLVGYMTADYFESLPGATTPPKPTRKLGDVNGDGVIDGFDMMAIKRHYLGGKQLTGIDFRAADVNKDGKADGFDMMAIKRHYLGNKKIEGVVE